MRITKSWLRDVRKRLMESQAILCGLAATDERCGNHNCLEAEFKRRYPHTVAKFPDNHYEAIREMLYDDLVRIIPSSICE